MTRVLLVFDDQYSARGFNHVSRSPSCRVQRFRVAIDWRPIRRGSGQSKFYAASSTRPVVDPHASAVRFDDGTANRQTETYAAVPLGDLAPPIELLENLLVLIGGDTGTAVDDGDLDPRALNGNPYIERRAPGVYLMAFSKRFTKTWPTNMGSIGKSGVSAGTKVCTLRPESRTERRPKLLRSPLRWPRPSSGSQSFATRVGSWPAN